MCCVKFAKFPEVSHREVSIRNPIIPFSFAMCFFSKGIQTIDSTRQFIGAI